MATPLTADQLVRALRAEGLRVVETNGWRTNNRNHVGKWGPVHGVMLHHTVTPKTMSAVPMCFSGISGLPGPLCHGVIRRDGTVYLVGNGRANHAGGGDPNVLQAVKDERYNINPPTPHQHQGSAGAVDGNAHFYGFECENEGDGTDPWPAVQIEAMVRACAAIDRSHLWSEKSDIEHSEWSDWKSDPKGPGYPGGAVMRARIKERLAHPASWTKPTAPTTPVPAPGGTVALPDFMHLIRTEDVVLLPDSPYDISWSGELADEGNDHGTGNATVAYADTTYSATLYLAFDEFEADDYLSVFPVYEGGTESNAGPVVDLFGNGTGPIRTYQAHFSGAVPTGKQLVFRVVNKAGDDVILTHARLTMLTWPS